MKITIAHLYPNLLNMFGDAGNINVLSKRLMWRGIECEIKKYSLEDEIDFDNTDILYIGGGSDKDFIQVTNALLKQKDSLIKFAENNGVILAFSGGQIPLGNYFVLDGKTVEGLGLLDMYTEISDDRIIGDIVIKTEFSKSPVVGFENHGGRTYLNSGSPFGSVLFGKGNNDTDLLEGIVYKNVFGTYLHGPLLPKNPEFCDFILKKALQNKYDKVELESLDDDLELSANEYIVNRFCN